MNKIIIALLSPNNNAYSETFIQVHKNSLNGNIKYFYGGIPPEYLEGYGKINPLYKKIINFLIGKFLNDPNYDEKKALKKAFIKEKIEIVFAEYGTLANAVLPICKTLKIPLIAHFHGADISRYDYLKQNNNYTELFQYASKIIAVSQSMKFKMIELGCPIDKIVWTPCAPNDKFFKINATLESLDFITVGRFVEKKAPQLSIIAFSKVLKEFPESKLYMAGDGPLLDHCKKLVSDLGLMTNVIFLGIISQETYIEYLTKVRAYVQHSVTAVNGDQEGTPVSVSEACLAGVPVITTKHSGIMDIIVDGETGYLVNEFDTDLMSEYMLRVLRDKSTSKVMGAKSKKYIFDNFSMNSHINKLNIAIKETLLLK